MCVMYMLCKRKGEGKLFDRSGKVVDEPYSLVVKWIHEHQLASSWYLTNYLLQ